MHAPMFIDEPTNQIDMNLCLLCHIHPFNFNPYVSRETSLGAHLLIPLLSPHEYVIAEDLKTQIAISVASHCDNTRTDKTVLYFFLYTYYTYVDADDMHFYTGNKRYQD